MAICRRQWSTIGKANANWPKNGKQGDNKNLATANAAAAAEHVSSAQ